MTKAVLLCGIIIYLFLSSFLISLTYVEVDEHWQPAFITEPSVYHENFTATSNISDYNIEVTEGAWVIKDNQLASRSLIRNEFIMIVTEMEAPIVTYNVSNLLSKTRFYVYYKSFEWGGALDTGYFEFDVENDIVNSVLYDEFEEEYTVLESKPYTFSKEDYIIKTDCSIDGKWWIPFTEDIVCTLYIDNVEFTSVLFEDLVKGVYHGGVYTEQWDLRINFISAIESVIELDVLSLLKYLKVIGVIILFLPPEIVMPFWMNFVFFKIPLVAVVWMGIETLRGTD